MNWKTVSHVLVDRYPHVDQGLYQGRPAEALSSGEWREHLGAVVVLNWEPTSYPSFPHGRLVDQHVFTIESLDIMQHAEL